jgi:pyruvate ferredoxin oxidoreductase alpha subunit
MRKILEGSKAIAETIELCRPRVVAVYPITPQTHIMENLAKLKAEGRAGFEYIKAESEMAAISAVLGASAAGARVYTASASQGILLMAEVLYNVGGMRLPVVMTCANRAVSAPINIWNDQQDAMILRDSGWIMLFAENNQEAADFHIIAYKIAEQKNLPTMVCADGMVLTHTFEPVNIREQKLVDEFLPAKKNIPGEFLDPKNPVTLGGMSTPESYMPTRAKIHEDLTASKKTLKIIFSDFHKKFSAKSGSGLTEYFGPKNPDLLLVAMGSVLGTIRHTLSHRLAGNKKIGVLKIKCFRPFPSEEISAAILKNKPKKIAVIDRAISLGYGGILGSDIKNLCHGKQVANFIVGLGGKDITPEDIAKIIKNGTTAKSSSLKFLS